MQMIGEWADISEPVAEKGDDVHNIAPSQGKEAWGTGSQGHGPQQMSFQNGFLEPE
jgi:hypothetical protein